MNDLSEKTTIVVGAGAPVVTVARTAGLGDLAGVHEVADAPPASTASADVGDVLRQLAHRRSHRLQLVARVAAEASRTGHRVVVISSGAAMLTPS
jgi:hypothetical protein